MNETKNGNGVYKMIAACLVTALISIIGAYFAVARNMVTKEELPALIQQNNPYITDSKDIKAKLDDLRAEQVRTTEQLRQVQIDTARIGEKLGVTASPGLSLRNK